MSEKNMKNGLNQQQQQQQYHNTICSFMINLSILAISSLIGEITKEIIMYKEKREEREVEIRIIFGNQDVILNNG